MTPLFSCQIRALTPLYNHQIILRAFAAAHQSFSHPAVLVFKSYHENDGVETDLRQLASSLGVSSSVFWVRDIEYDAMPGLYAFADAVVNFPAMDAFPVSLMEAAACQTPVITIALPSYRDTFIERHMRLVSSGSTDELATAMAIWFAGGGTEMRRN